jgi:hypothetical protein
MTKTVQIDVSHGEAKATLTLESGPGTDDPSVLLTNHSREAIVLGEVRRFSDEDLK